MKLTVYLLGLLGSVSAIQTSHLRPARSLEDSAAVPISSPVNKKLVTGPWYNGQPLDNCWDSTYKVCGKPVADAYCRTQGYTTSVGDPTIRRNTNQVSGMMGGGINPNPTSDIITALECV